MLFSDPLGINEKGKGRREESGEGISLKGVIFLR